MICLNLSLIHLKGDNTVGLSPKINSKFNDRTTKCQALQIRQKSPLEDRSIILWLIKRET
jgi:hypothetical protein